MRAALPLALALLLAGCASSPEPEAAAPVVEAPEQPPLPEPEAVGFGLGLAGGTPFVGFVLPVDDRRAARFSVPEGATRVLVEAEWTCATPGAACGLDFGVSRGDADASAASGVSPLSFEAEVEPGAWTLWAFPSSGGSAVVGMDGEARLAFA